MSRTGGALTKCMYGLSRGQASRPSYRLVAATAQCGALTIPKSTTGSGAAVHRRQELLRQRFESDEDQDRYSRGESQDRGTAEDHAGIECTGVGAYVLKRVSTGEQGN